MTDRRANTNLESDLAALADGSLTPKLREQALERVREDPRHQHELEIQRQAVELVRSVEVRAPASLHQRLSHSAGSTARHRRRSRARAVTVGGLAVAMAAVLAILIANLGSAGSAASFAKISALTLAPATMPAAGESPSDHSALQSSVGGVAFPYWEGRFGWRATGMRVDHLSGHAVTTVFYENPGGGRIGYAIVAGEVSAPHAGRVLWRGGVSYRLLVSHGAQTLAWRRDGHLCVISGRGVNSRTLLGLASWEDGQRRV